MFFWDDVLKAGLGAAAGATSSAPYGGTAYKGDMTDDERRDNYGRSISRVEGWADGSQPVQTQATISRLTKGSEADLEGTAAGARQRASERALQLGGGPRGSMLPKRLGEIDRSLLDAKRRLKGPLLANMQAQEPEYRMRAQGMLFPQLNLQEQMDFQDWQRMEEMKAAKKAAGSQLHRTLAGAAGAMGGGSMFGGNPGYGAAPQASGGGGYGSGGFYGGGDYYVNRPGSSGYNPSYNYDGEIDDSQQDWQG